MTIPHEPSAMHRLSVLDRRLEMLWIEPLVRRCSEIAGSTIPSSIGWSPRFTNCMGKARCRFEPVNLSDPAATRRIVSGEVIFSASALWRRATPSERQNTVIHEAAHVLANEAAGTNVGHGRQWKFMMITLGAKPERCHTVNRDGLRRRRRGQAPTPVPVPDVTSGPMVGQLVSFQVEGNGLVGRVLAESEDHLVVGLIGDHIRARFGLARMVHKSEARPG